MTRTVHADDPAPLPDDVARRAQQAPSAALFLDYDGTLVGFAPTPDLAPPDDDLLALLAALAARPGLCVHLASGRRREELDGWFGALPIGLYAEHCFWSKRVGAAWTPLDPTVPAWKPAVAVLLGAAVARTPGSFVEEKTASLAWHYRLASPELARARLGELRLALVGLVEAAGLELLSGAAVLEVRPRGVHKGRAPGIADVPEGALVVAVGDDRTDEDLFAALAPPALTIHVGGGASCAAFALPDPAAVRRFLRGFLDPFGPSSVHLPER